MEVIEEAALRQARGQAFALATVVRTISVTAAKAGAKALIAPDGSIEEGWIGGGCARAAVIKAARQCLATAGRGSSRLRPRTRSPNSGRRRARSAAGSSTPGIPVRARERWTSSSSRSYRARGF